MASFFSWKKRKIDNTTTSGQGYPIPGDIVTPVKPAIGTIVPTVDEITLKGFETLSGGSINTGPDPAVVVGAVSNTGDTGNLLTIKEGTSNSCIGTPFTEAVSTIKGGLRVDLRSSTWIGTPFEDSDSMPSLIEDPFPTIAAHRLKDGSERSLPPYPIREYPEDIEAPAPPVELKEVVVIPSKPVNPFESTPQPLSKNLDELCKNKINFFMNHSIISLEQKIIECINTMLSDVSECDFDSQREFERTIYLTFSESVLNVLKNRIKDLEDRINKSNYVNAEFVIKFNSWSDGGYITIRVNMKKLLQECGR